MPCPSDEDNERGETQLKCPTISDDGRYCSFSQRYRSWIISTLAVILFLGLLAFVSGLLLVIFEPYTYTSAMALGAILLGLVGLFGAAGAISAFLVLSSTSEERTVNGHLNEGAKKGPRNGAEAMALLEHELAQRAYLQRPFLLPPQHERQPPPTTTRSSSMRRISSRRRKFIPPKLSKKVPLSFVLVDKGAKKGGAANGSEKPEGCYKTSADNVDSTETLMRSIRGIPFLIQAIQYSLETSIHNDPSFRTSVIHTAPGCTSVLDCNEEEQLSSIMNSITPRCSGPEEQWEVESGEHVCWTNQQLKLSLNRENSSLAVFPYSESQPVKNDSLESLHLNLQNQHRDCCAGGNVSTGPTAWSSRVTVSRPGTGARRDIRCIGMSSVFLSKFNNSFRT